MGRSNPKVYPTYWVYTWVTALFRGTATTSVFTYLDMAHPNIIVECAQAIERFAGKPPGGWNRPDTACLRLSSYGPIWPLLFPQAGPGKKHEREIKLADWQERIVREFPRQLIRGLIHSDGSRCMNTFSVELKDGPRAVLVPAILLHQLLGRHQADLL